MPTLGRQSRLAQVLELVQSWGWEPDPRLQRRYVHTSLWWLPHTPWRLRCTAQDCTVYRRRTGMGATQSRTYPLYALDTIRQALAQIHATTTEARS